jgi:1,2-diacylglycerol 3-beta-galactosyltransferase
MPDLKRILLLYSDTGGGHRSAALAIREALESAYPGRYQVELLDALTEYAPLPLNYAPQFYPELTSFPRAWKLGYRLMDGRRRARALTAALWPYVRSPAQRLLAERPADLLVSVHPLLVSPLLRAKGLPAPPLVTVVTDLVTTHALWFHPESSLCILPTEAARDRALRYGLPEERLRVTGLPVSRGFSPANRNRAALRRQLGWPPGRPVVLLMGGGDGLGPIYETARAIARPGGDFCLAVVAGRNRRLQQRLQAVGWEVPTFLYGFQEQLAPMMQAATLLVSKAGPSTITEAVNTGLPMVLYGRIPGQEDGNVSYVEQQGVGVWAPGPERTARAVHRWLRHPAELRKAARACRRIARPSAASEIAEILDGLLQASAQSRGRQELVGLH